MGFAQGDAILLLQYNRGPDLDAFYRKWNFDLHTHMVYGNMREDYTVRKSNSPPELTFNTNFPKPLPSIQG